MQELRREARRDVEAKKDSRFRNLDVFAEKESEVETLVQSRLEKALAEAGP